MLFYYDPILLEHDTGKHPERPQRLVQVMAHLQRTGLLSELQRPSWQPASLDRVGRVHTPEYLHQLKSFAEAGGGYLDPDTPSSGRSYEVALKAAGAVCDAVQRVVSGEQRRAFCLIRPPGHHALADAAMGFCLLNHVAIAARVAIDELGLERVLIIDWDVHHGNGTQAIFWEDPAVGYLSIHRWPFFPGTGAADETGSGAGLGTTLNIPVEFPTERSEYLALFRAGLERMADKMRPQLVLISAGFDSHRDDPIGSLGLETEDFITLTESVVEVANTHAGGRIVSVLEGGYNPGVLAGCVEVHVQRLA